MMIVDTNSTALDSSRLESAIERTKVSSKQHSSLCKNKQRTNQNYFKNFLVVASSQ